MIKLSNIIKENQQARKFFRDVILAAQRQNKFSAVIQMLEDDYGIWFTDDPNISQSDLDYLLVRSDFGAISSHDMSAIANHVKKIIHI